MSNTSLELDRARAILTTYHQVHDTAYNHSQTRLRTTLIKKNQELENELNQLKEKYVNLQGEYYTQEKHLAQLNKQLNDRTCHITRLQEDFENAIYQLKRQATKDKDS